jgi:hypothetical protein
MHGWWDDDLATARKYRSRIGGSVDGARIVLVDEQVRRVRKSWPD